jgi:hypothetical protein
LTAVLRLPCSRLSLDVFDLRVFGVAIFLY